MRARDQLVADTPLSPFSTSELALSLSLCCYRLQVEQAYDLLVPRDTGGESCMEEFADQCRVIATMCVAPL